MTGAFIPYGAYWSTPFAKWQGSLAHLHSLKLAARIAKQTLETRKFPRESIDHAILGITNPQKSSFFGLPWVTGMMGLESVTGPTVQQACATSVRAMQMAAQEIGAGTATCSLVITADRMSNGPVVYYPDPTAPGGQGITESWTLDNFANDPHANNAMIDTAENVARRYQISTQAQHDVVLLEPRCPRSAQRDSFGAVEGLVALEPVRDDGAHERACIEQARRRARGVHPRAGVGGGVGCSLESIEDLRVDGTGVVVEPRADAIVGER